MIWRHRIEQVAAVGLTPRPAQHPAPADRRRTLVPLQVLRGDLVQHSGTVRMLEPSARAC